MEVEISKPAAATLDTRTGGCGFTAADLAAADQLVQLSVSGGGEEEDGHHDACSSSSLSVNNAEAPAREEDETGTGAGMVDRRARKRYRLVSELYAATRQVQAKGGGGKRKGRDGTEN